MRYVILYHHSDNVSPHVHLLDVDMLYDAVTLITLCALVICSH